MKNYQIYKLFPTPVFHFKLENYQELNIELESYILDLKKKKIKMVKENQTMEVGILVFLIKKTMKHQKNLLLLFKIF